MDQRKKKPIEALIFDMDGLMFDTERIFLRAWIRVGEELHLSGMESFAYEILGVNAEGTKQRFLKQIGTKETYERATALCAQYAKEIRDFQPLPVKPGLPELLGYLREKGYPAAVASSTGRASVESYLERAGIRDSFSAVLGGDMVRHSKPNPEIYTLACRELQREPAVCLALEDSPNGICSAYSAGIPTVMVPDLVPLKDELRPLLLDCVPDLSQVIPILQKLGKFG